MSEVIGANLNDLQELVREFRAAADQFDGARNSVLRAVARTAWQGQTAEQFRAEWDAVHAVVMGNLAGDLRHAATVILTNADEQRRTSASHQGSSGSLGFHEAGDVTLTPFIGGSVDSLLLAAFYRAVANGETEKFLLEHPEFAQQFPNLAWATTTGKAELDGLKGKSDTEVKDWWAKLDPEKQKALMLAYPGALMLLTGLPPAVIDAAKEQFGLSQREFVKSKTVMESEKVTVNVGFAKIGAEGSYKATQFADGHVEIDLSLTGTVGKELGESEVGVEGGVTQTYSFASAAEAQAFLEGLRARIGQADLGAYLESNGSHRIGTEASLALTGETKVEIGGQSVKLDGSAGGTVNLDTGAKSLFVEGHASVDVAGVKGNVGAHFDLQLDKDNHVVGATMTGSVSLSGQASVEGILESLSGKELASASASTSSGGQASFSAHLDLTNPAVQQQLDYLVQHPGDMAAIQKLLATSDATITVDAVSSSHSESKVLGSGVEHDMKTTTNQLTYVKPSGGPWVPVQT